MTDACGIARPSADVQRPERRPGLLSSSLPKRRCPRESDEQRASRGVGEVDRDQHALERQRQATKRREARCARDRRNRARGPAQPPSLAFVVRSARRSDDDDVSPDVLTHGADRVGWRTGHVVHHRSPFRDTGSTHHGSKRQ